MPQSDQAISKNRYMLIPRTVIFICKGDEYLLIKGADTKKLWAGKYNGLGGHVEKGEDVISSAKRELFEEAARIVVRHQQGSVSLLQRRLSVGYSRAARLIDQLEEAGIVGQFDGSKAREVMIEDEAQLEIILKSL